MNGRINQVAAQLALVIGLLGCGQSARGAEPPPPRFVTQWGHQGKAAGEFDFPIGIAVSAADEVFVSDFKNSRVQRFTADGEFLSAIATAMFPGGLGIDGDGNLYVAHFGIPPSRYEGPRQRDKIAVYSPDGKPLCEWGQTGTGDGEFDEPGDVEIVGDEVYVADQCNRRVQVFDRQGKFLRKWGQKGFGAGEFGGNPHPKAFFAGPTFLAIDKAGQVFTSEGPLCRIQVFTAGGRSLRQWGDNADAPGKLGGYFTAFEPRNMRGPMGICFDGQGRLWVASLSGRIQQFTAEGEYLAGFGQEGTGPGQFYAPHGLAIDSRDSLYVVDAFNHRVQKFARSER